MTRQEANRELVEKISEMVEAYPELRFHQLLMINGISNGKDQFYEESEVTLKNFNSGNKY